MRAVLGEFVSNRGNFLYVCSSARSSAGAPWSPDWCCWPSLTVTTTSASAQTATSTRTAATTATRASSAPAARANPRWAPSRNYVPYQGARFGYLSEARPSMSRIRGQVLATIQSTWGGPRDRYGIPLPGQRPDPDRHLVLR